MGTGGKHRKSDALSFLVVIALLPVLTATRAAAASQSCWRAPWTNAAEYQAFVDHRDANWTGADLPTMFDAGDGRTVFLFGDTVYRDVNRDGSAGMWHAFASNSVWVKQAGCLRMLNAPGRSFVVPSTHARDGSVYWPAGAVRTGSTITMFATRLRPGIGFGTMLGVDALTLRARDLAVARVEHVRWGGTRAITWGESVVAAGSNLYVYGSRRSRAASCGLSCVSTYVARVRIGAIGERAAWSFFDGTRFTANEARAAPITPGHEAHSSVQAFRGGYLSSSRSTPTS